MAPAAVGTSGSRGRAAAARQKDGVSPQARERVLFDGAGGSRLRIVGEGRKQMRRSARGIPPGFDGQEVRRHGLDLAQISHSRRLVRRTL